MFKGLDHLAIAVSNTEEALRVWRDRFGFPVVFSEEVDNGAVLLTHLDLGNTHLQLVQPLRDDHPLWDWLKANGPRLHHICLRVDDVGSAYEETRLKGLSMGESQPHQGTLGKRAIFLDPGSTCGVQVELTGD